MFQKWQMTLPFYMTATIIITPIYWTPDEEVLIYSV